MDLKSQAKLILNRNDIYEGDYFLCLRTANANVKRRYQYKDGKIKTINGDNIKPLTVKNLINYYIFKKCS